MNRFSTAFRRISLPEARDLKLLLFWPVFGLAFLWLERAVSVSDCTPMRCALDDLIPFCPWFVIPYGAWFLFVGGMVLYTLLWEPTVFRKLMCFISFTYSAALLICLSTVFLKQHSALDVLAAMPVCAVGCLLTGWPDRPGPVRGQRRQAPELEGAYK